MKSDLDGLMQASNLDALLIFGDAENNPAMYYFVGGGHISGALLIKKVGKDPVLFYNEMERDEAAKSGLKTMSTINMVPCQILLLKHWPLRGTSRPRHAGRSRSAAAAGAAGRTVEERELDTAINLGNLQPGEVL